MTIHFLALPALPKISLRETHRQLLNRLRSINLRQTDLRCFPSKKSKKGSATSSQNARTSAFHSPLSAFRFGLWTWTWEPFRKHPCISLHFPKFPNRQRKGNVATHVRQASYGRNFALPLPSKNQKREAPHTFILPPSSLTSPPPTLPPSHSTRAPPPAAPDVSPSDNPPASRNRCWARTFADCDRPAETRCFGFGSSGDDPF